MKVMDHLGLSDVTEENLDFFRSIGVDCLLVHLPAQMADMQDHTEDFVRLRGFVESHGLELFALHSGALPRDQIAYALPGRDKQIEAWCKVLRAIGSAGVRNTATTFYAIGHFRTESTAGRGGSLYSTFDYDEFKLKPQDYPGREIDADGLWENLAYFLDRIVPVAEEARVRIAVHPDDPPIPEPLGGAARIVISPDNYQKIFDLAGSAAIGMLFCQGCVAEMGANVIETIHRFGTQDRIVFVHFRNIRGGPYSFQEVFIDEGDQDMLLAMQAYRDAGFRGPFMMDHTPDIRHPSGGWAGRAYANGYIKALVQTVYR